tara:strand:+ start:489 stop:650 length:162 start_codon:yes stop_codon:yes gene_type:complete
MFNDGTHCQGTGGSGWANWGSDLAYPKDAINVRVAFENPGVSWGIKWDCNLGF